MRLGILTVVATAVLSLGALSVHAQSTARKPESSAPVREQALYQCPMNSEIQATWPAKCPKCGMTLQKVLDPSRMIGPQKGQSSRQTPKQDNTAGRQKLTETSVGNDGPAALLSIRDRLKLTDEQVTNLESLASETGQKAQAFLTDEQRKTLAAIAEEPQSATGSRMMGRDMGQHGAGQAEQPPSHPQIHEAHQRP